jgi:hypothetical protein
MFRAAVPDHVRRPLAHRPGEDGVDRFRQHACLVLYPAGDACRFEHLAGTGELLVERGPPVAGDGLADLAQGLTRHVFDVMNLCRRLLRRRGKEPAGQLALECDEGEAVAEEVVQIPGEAQPLFADGKTGELFPRRPQLGDGGDLADESSSP